MLEVITSEELYKRGEIEGWEYRMPQFHDKTIIRFPSLKEAMRFGRDFAQNYLVPKYGLEEALKFPMAKSGPFRDGDAVLAEALGLQKPNPEEATWLVVPSNKFHEVQKYMNERQ